MTATGGIAAATYRSSLRITFAHRIFPIIYNGLGDVPPKLPFYWGNPGHPTFIHNSTPQTTPRSVRPFCRAHDCDQQTHTDTRTHRRTDHATSVTISRIEAHARAVIWLTIHWVTGCSTMYNFFRIARILYRPYIVGVCGVVVLCKPTVKFGAKKVWQSCHRGRLQNSLAGTMSFKVDFNEKLDLVVSASWQFDTNTVVVSNAHSK